MRKHALLFLALLLLVVGVNISGCGTAANNLGERQTSNAWNQSWGTEGYISTGVTWFDDEAAIEYFGTHTVSQWYAIFTPLGSSDPSPLPLSANNAAARAQAVSGGTNATTYWVDNYGHEFVWSPMPPPPPPPEE